MKNHDGTRWKEKVLCSCSHVSLHTIAKDDPDAPTVCVWHGDLRVVLRERVMTGEENIPPTQQLQLKLEFINKSPRTQTHETGDECETDSIYESGNESGNENQTESDTSQRDSSDLTEGAPQGATGDRKVWAEVWYNPLHRFGKEGDTSISWNSNNGMDTIVELERTVPYFQVVAQLPGSGFFPEVFYKGQLSKQEMASQVALGLRFRYHWDGWDFMGVLEQYKVKFAEVLDAYNEGLNEEVQSLQEALKSVDITLVGSEDVQERDVDETDDEDDDFGDFIEAK